MIKSVKLALMAAIAAVVLVSAVGTASATRISISNRNIRATWNPTAGGGSQALTFTGLGGAITIGCNVTIEGSFHSNTITKTAGSLIGYITQAAVARPCAGGEAWVLNNIESPPSGGRVQSLPWHIQYDSFVGTLPTFSGVRLRLVGAAFLVQIPFAASCLFRSTAANPARGTVNVASGQATTLTAEAGSQIPLQTRLAGSLFDCPATGSFTGNAIARLLGTGALILVRLI